jgi:hypothetical protein
MYSASSRIDALSLMQSTGKYTLNSIDKKSKKRTQGITDMQRRTCRQILDLALLYSHSHAVHKQPYRDVIEHAC